MEEVSAALKEMKRDKVGGADGLTVDFLKVFWKILKVPYYNMIKEVIDRKCFNATSRRGIISLLPKLGRDLLLVKG